MTWEPQNSGRHCPSPCHRKTSFSPTLRHLFILPSQIVNQKTSRNCGKVVFHNLCGGSARTQLQTLPPCARAGVWRDCPCGTCGVFLCGVVWQDISRCVQSHTSTHPTTEALHSSSAGEPTSSPADRRRQTKRPHQFAAVTFPGSADVVHGILHSADRRRLALKQRGGAAAVTLSVWPQAAKRRCQRLADRVATCAAVTVVISHPARLLPPDRGRIAGGVELVPLVPPPALPFPVPDTRRSTFRLARPAGTGGAPNPQ